MSNLSLYSLKNRGKSGYRIKLVCDCLYQIYFHNALTNVDTNKDGPSAFLEVSKLKCEILNGNL